MKFLAVVSICFTALIAAPKQQYLSVDECNKIFEQRKAELALQVERLGEKEQAINALQNANKGVQGQKDQRLTQKLNDLNRVLSETSKKEKICLLQNLGKLMLNMKR